MPNRNTETKTASDPKRPWPNERIGAVNRGGNGSDPSASVGLADAVQALSVEGGGGGSDQGREKRGVQRKRGLLLGGTGVGRRGPAQFGAPG